ncbi:MAG: glycosyltransferase family 4 protein [Bacteroidales bacterium]|nr:glycosyltransferase family 4 protein [Bacteroidales bacterium]
MKILEIPAYFYPERVSSSLLDDQLHQAIADACCNMLLYVPTPTRNVTPEVRKEYKKKKKETLYGGHMSVHRFSLYGEEKKPFLRALRYTFACIKQFNRLVFCKEARLCDAMFITSTPPIKGAMASIAKKFNHKPLIYNLQDIFPDSLVGSGLAKKGGLLWKIGRKIEDFTYRHADKIIVISEDFKKNIMAKGVPEEKIEVIYNWVDADSVKPVEKAENPLFEEFGLDREKFTVVYAGNLGNAQNIGIILDAAAKLQEIQFAVFGTGGLEEEIRSRIEKEGLKNVHLNPLQPMERVSQVYSLGDACIVSCKAGLGGSAMPSKTWSIMSCGRPVIASFDEGELKDIIEKNECGVFSHASNLQEFVEVIKILAANPARCEELGKNARKFILNNLTKEVGTKKYVDVIKSFEKKES